MRGHPGCAPGGDGGAAAACGAFPERIGESSGLTLFAYLIAHIGRCFELEAQGERKKKKNVQLLKQKTFPPDVSPGGCSAARSHPACSSPASGLLRRNHG